MNQVGAPAVCAVAVTGVGGGVSVGSRASGHSRVSCVSGRRRPGSRRWRLSQAGKQRGIRRGRGERSEQAAADTERRCGLKPGALRPLGARGTACGAPTGQAPHRVGPGCRPKLGFGRNCAISGGLRARMGCVGGHPALVHAPKIKVQLPLVVGRSFDPAFETSLDELRPNLG